jgi:hypothetical protein
MFRTKLVEKAKTHISCSVTFIHKWHRLWCNLEKYSRARQVTADNIIWRVRIACWLTKATDTHPEHVVLRRVMSLLLLRKYRAGFGVGFRRQGRNPKSVRTDNSPVLLQSNHLMFSTARTITDCSLPGYLRRLRVITPSLYISPITCCQIHKMRPQASDLRFAESIAPPHRSNVSR